MQYKIIVDTQSRENPSADKKEYVINIEELRRKGNIYDSLNITLDRTYVIRKLSLSEYGVLSELDEPITEELTEVNVELFEGDNYIYLSDMSGNNFYAEYIVKNDFTDTYVTVNQMTSTINEAASSIELSVNQKLEGYSTTEEMNTAIELSSSTIMLEVNKKVGEDELGTKIEQNWESVQIAWNNISEYIQFKEAQLQILDSNNKLLMSLDRVGQHFYESNGDLIGDIGIINYTIDDTEVPMIAFNLNIENNNPKGMAWGIQAEDNFYPIFYVTGTYAPESSEYGGKFIVAGEFEAMDMICNHLNVNVSLTCRQANCTSNLLTDKLIRNSDAYNATVIRTYVEQNKYMEGYALTGTNTEHTYQCAYITTSAVTDIAFYVDGNYIGGTSDKRLKSNIKQIDNKIIKAIDKTNYYQFNTKKDPNAISVGIIAQELEKNLKKEGLKSNDYTILSKFAYNLNDSKEYYKVDYEQFLLLKIISLEEKLKLLEQKIKIKEV